MHTDKALKFNFASGIWDHTKNDSKMSIVYVMWSIIVQKRRIQRTLPVLVGQYKVKSEQMSRYRGHYHMNNVLNKSSWFPVLYKFF